MHETGKEDQSLSDYVIHEQPIQSILLQKRSNKNLQLLKTTEHNQTINNKKQNQQLEC